MKRREFITVLGGAAAAWPLAARAQQPSMPIIGFVIARSPDPSEMAAFRQGLAESGYVEERNVAIELRGTEDIERLPALAADLVQHRVALIIAGGLTSAIAVKAASSWPPTIR